LKTWRARREDSKMHPRLAETRDETGDGAPEVNRPEEIEALIASVREALSDFGSRLERTRVSGSRTSGSTVRGPSTARCRTVERGGHAVAIASFHLLAVTGLGLAVTGLLMTRDGLSPAWLPFVYTLHDLLGILFLCGVAAHAYLAVVANPGALRGILDGCVGKTWAKEHHSRWEAAAGEDSEEGK
jgi:cytochrome b subunit of formate dehydrogenase